MIRTAGYYFIALFALSLAAFMKTYFVRPSQFREPYTHLHAALMIAWFGILIAQPFLIRREYRAAHRLLGRISYVLVPVLASSILLLAHARISALGSLGADARFFFLPFGMTILLVVPWALGVRHRHDVGLHARYMICTAFAVFDPVLGRLLYFYGPALPTPDTASLIAYLAAAAVLVALMLRDRRGRRVYAFMLVLVTLVFGGFATVARSDAWHDAVAWFGTRALT